MDSLVLKRGLTGSLAVVVGLSMSVGSAAVVTGDAYAASMTTAATTTQHPQVTNVTADGASPTSIELAFDEVEGAEQYRISYREGSSETWTDAVADDTDYVIRGLESGTRYKVRVCAVFSDGDGPWSKAVTASTLHAKPAKVTGIALAKRTASSLKVKWSKAKGADGYEVAYKKSSAGTWRYRYTSARSLNVTGLKQATKYKFKVRGANDDWDGAWSATKAYKTLYAKPAKVTGVSLAKKTTSSLKVKWSKAKYAQKYRYAYKKSSGSWHYGTTTARSKTFSGLASGTSYKVKVRGVNGSKMGSWSATKTYATKAKPAPKRSSASTNSESTYPSTVYITRTGTKYHKSWCPSLSRSKIVIGINDAKARGYTACKICF